MAMPVYVVESDVAYGADAKAEQAVQTTCGKASAVSDVHALTKRVDRAGADDDEPADGGADDEVRLGDGADDAVGMSIATVRIFAIDLEGLPEGMANGTLVRVRAIGVLGAAEITGATNGSTNVSLACDLDPTISDLAAYVLLEVWATTESGRKPAMVGRAQAPIGNNTSGRDKYLLQGGRKIRFAYITISWSKESPAFDSNYITLSAGAASTRGSGNVPIVGVVCAGMLAALAVVAAAKGFAERAPRAGGAMLQ